MTGRSSVGTPLQISPEEAAAGMTAGNPAQGLRYYCLRGPRGDPAYGLPDGVVEGDLVPAMAAIAIMNHELSSGRRTGN